MLTPTENFTLLTGKEPQHPLEIRTLSNQELDGVSGAFWFVVGFMAISLAPPLAGAIYGMATRGPKDGPSCPI
jgi:hypothetical protein